MKLQIVLFILGAAVLCCSSEKIKGRRSNLRVEHLLRNERDNPSRGRFLHKKGNQAPAQPTILIIENQPPTTSNLDYTDTEPEYIYNVDFEGFASTSPAENSSRRLADDDEFLDSEDDVDNEQTLIRNKKQNSNLKLKKINGKKQIYAPVSNSAKSKKNVNKLHFVRLNGNSNFNRNSDNLALRRLFIQQ